MNRSWLAAYFYYNEPWEDFLIRALQPFVQHVLNEKLAEQFFFIRYWERGPHIRLRFKGDTDILLKQVKPKIELYFNEYFQSHPSKEINAPWLDKLPLDQRYFPNNSIQFIDYEPEIERYGGIFAIEIAERQFQASSNAVLSAIAESNNWDYEKALGTAIQMHLAFAFAVGMNLDDLNFFYDIVYRSWFHRSYYNYEATVSEDELEKRAQITLNAYEDNFNKQKDFLVEFHKTLWSAFSEGAEFEDEWMNVWISEMKSVYKELSVLQENDKLITIMNDEIEKKYLGDNKNVKRMYIYESYVHMTNNRLGILNRDEAFLGYLIKRSVEFL